MSRFFFLSYAHHDHDPFLKKFIKELTTEVAVLSGEREEQVGFVDDHDIGVGAQWSPALAAALNDSHVLLALYSPAYFQRPICGQEWMAFRMRQEFHMQVLNQAHPPPVIIPLLWVAPDRIRNLPYVAREIQYTHAALGAEYSRVGLRQLIKVGAYSDDYERFKSSLAGMIVDTAEVNLARLPEDPLLNSLHNAFDLPDPADPVPARSGEIGPRYVKFVYVAGRRDELSQLRKRLEAYGEAGGHQWQPYHPTDENEVAVVAQGVASEKNLYYEAIPVDAHTVRRIEQAHQNRNAVILIVDAWTVRVDPYYNTMRELDERKHLLYVVVIPSNENDEETSAAAADLARALQAVFHYRSSQADSAFYVGRVTSLGALKTCLSEIMERMRERIVADAPPLQVGPEVPMQTLPVVSPIVTERLP